MLLATGGPLSLPVAPELITIPLVVVSFFAIIELCHLIAHALMQSVAVTLDELVFNELKIPSFAGEM